MSQAVWRSCMVTNTGQRNAQGIQTHNGWAQSLVPAQFLLSQEATVLVFVLDVLIIQKFEFQMV